MVEGTEIESAVHNAEQFISQKLHMGEGRAKNPHADYDLGTIVTEFTKPGVKGKVPMIHPDAELIAIRNTPNIGGDSNYWETPTEHFPDTPKEMFSRPLIAVIIPGNLETTNRTCSKAYILTPGMARTLAESKDIDPEWKARLIQYADENINKDTGDYDEHPLHGKTAIITNNSPGTSTEETDRRYGLPRWR